MEREEKRPPIQISYISNTNCKLFKNKRTFSALLLIIFPFKFFFLSNFFFQQCSQTAFVILEKDPKRAISNYKLNHDAPIGDTILFKSLLFFISPSFLLLLLLLPPLVFITSDELSTAIWIRMQYTLSKFPIQNTRRNFLPFTHREKKSSSLLPPSLCSSLYFRLNSNTVHPVYTPYIPSCERSPSHLTILAALLNPAPIEFLWKHRWDRWDREYKGTRVLKYESTRV